MTDSFDTVTGERENARIGRAAVRKSHSIRFSDAEWQTIQARAEKQEMMPGEYVRHAALNMGAGEPPVLAELPPGLVRLIGQTYRAAYFISTVKRAEMLRDGRDDEIDDTIKQGRLAHAEIMKGG